jgi:hypothetical protein
METCHTWRNLAHGRVSNSWPGFYRGRRTVCAVPSGFYFVIAKLEVTSAFHLCSLLRFDFSKCHFYLFGSLHVLSLAVDTYLLS